MTGLEYGLQAAEVLAVVVETGPGRAGGTAVPRAVASVQVPPSQVGSVGDLVGHLARLFGLVATAAVLAALTGAVHRWYARERVPDGLAILVGVSGVAIYLNTAGALGDVVGGEDDLLALNAAVFNVVTFAVAGVAASAGGRLGDRVGVNLFAVSGGRAVERDVGRIVRTVGRVTTVELPEDVEDMEGYDPVAPETKAMLAGNRLLFPRRLTVEELRTRLVERLKTDYGVGHVDVDLAADGTVEYLALGGRESGIGPTLPPGSAAVAVSADPANSASPGDTVQLWTGGEGAPGGGSGDAAAARDAADGGSGATEADRPRHVLNAELRGSAGDVVTLAMDESEALSLDPDRRYRLVTLPVGPRVDREFAAQLRAAEETTGVVTIREDSPLVAATVGALDLAVVGVRSPDGDLEAIPSRDRTLGVGDTVYAIARPDRLRRLETAAGGPAADGADSAGDGSDASVED